jgi:iron-sulfur cluster repair protein YtfE (RIC family)
MTAHDPEDWVYQRVLDEHRELKELLGRIDQALAERSATIAEIGGLLGQLGDRLIKHFATEEDDGYFAEALTHAPQLISTANQLLAQHPRMSSEAQRIASEAADRPAVGPDWWDQTAERFRAFRDELLKHETRENVLLQEAYSQDIGSHD